MQRISVFIPDETKRTINITAKAANKTEAEIIRDALSKGLKANHPKSNAQALLDLAKMAKKIPTKGKVPADFIKNLDYYTWGGEKRD